MRNAGLEEAQAGIKIARRNINNLRYADDTTLMAESEEELKSLLMKVRGEWKSWLKAQHSENQDHGIRSHHFMGNRWGNSGNSVRLSFLGSKITTDGDCSHEIKRRLLLGRKVMTNLDSIFKSRDIVNKGPSSQGYGFSCGHVWMWELDCEEGWAPKNWWFWAVVLEKTLESPLECKEIQPVHSEGVSPGISLEGMMLKLKLQYFHHLMWRVESMENLWCWEGLGAGGEGDDRGWDGWMASVIWWTWVWVNFGGWWWTRRPGVLRFMGSQRVGHDWATELNWTDLVYFWFCCLYFGVISKYF